MLDNLPIHVQQRPRLATKLDRCPSLHGFGCLGGLNKMARTKMSPYGPGYHPYSSSLPEMNLYCHVDVVVTRVKRKRMDATIRGRAHCQGNEELIQAFGLASKKFILGVDGVDDDDGGDIRMEEPALFYQKDVYSIMTKSISEWGQFSSCTTEVAGFSTQEMRYHIDKGKRTVVVEEFTTEESSEVEESFASSESS
ncbi:hypothetical protein LINPERPRIM_LOCUS21866 [Linum perenne]